MDFQAKIFRFLFLRAFCQELQDVTIGVEQILFQKQIVDCIFAQKTSVFLNVLLAEVVFS